MVSSSVGAPNIKLTAAAVHAAPVYMDKKATTAKVVRLIEDAGKKGVKLLGFPECFIPGYAYFCHAYPPLQQVDALVNLGVSERMPNGYTLFISQVVLDDDGALLGVYRKVQPSYAERLVWAQGGGWSIRAWKTRLEYRPGGLCCWEHTFNGARQARIAQDEHVHVGAWPGLSTIQGFESVADAQTEALMKTHALTAQVFVLSAANYVEWMEENIGKQDYVKAGGGWSAVIAPFCAFLAGPHMGAEEKLVTAELDFGTLGPIKVWIDGNGHYKRPEIFDFKLDTRPLWANEGVVPRFPDVAQNEVPQKCTKDEDE